MNRPLDGRALRLPTVLVMSLLQACAVATVTEDGGGGNQDVVAHDGADAGDASTMDARDGRAPDAAGEGGADARADGGGTTCTSNADCHAAAAPVCDTAAHICVECLPTMDTCGSGRVCDAATHTCVSGCRTDSDCLATADGGVRDASADARTDGGRTDGGSADGGGVSPPAATHCLTAQNRCVQCLGDTDCPLGMLCSNNACVAGCSATHGCPGSATCCSGACRNTASDPMACGGCGTQCSGSTNSCCDGTCISTLADNMNCGGCGVACAPAHATGRCLSGICGIGTCDPGYSNADLMAGNGCECQVGTGGGACSMATGVGPVAVGSSTTVSGVLTATSANNWYVITFATGGNPHVLMSNTAGGVYTMDVQSACGPTSTTALSCADQAAGALNVTEYYFFDTSDAPHSSRMVNPPATAYVHVYSMQQPSGCTPYSIVISN